MTGKYPEQGRAAVRLDGIDATLLVALQEDGRLRLEDLARLVGLSSSSVHDRLQRLRRDGVIRRWTVDVSPEALGLCVLAFVGVRTSRPCDELVEPIWEYPEVVEYHAVAGALGAMLKVRTTTLERLEDVIQRLRRLPGVEGTETTIVLKTYAWRGPRPPVAS